MNVITLMMLGTACCYTITSLSDKRAARDGFSPDEFTFLMCLSMSAFLTFTLPFQSLHFKFGIKSMTGILLTAGCKFLEFNMSVIILRCISAFELKAWLGITLFASYLSDILLGGEMSLIRLLSLFVIAAGLFMIVRSEKSEPVQYRRIAVPLVLYLISKFGYGLVIRTFSKYASSTILLLAALLLVAAFTFHKIRPDSYRERLRQTAAVVLARIPNTVGMLLENAVIAVSLAQYSLIQPVILVTLFLISLLRREQYSGLNILGSLLCMAGVTVFQLISW